jgi:hypothetical protein
MRETGVKKELIITYEFKPKDVKFTLYFALLLCFQVIRSWWFLQVATLIVVFTTVPCSPTGVVGTLRSFRDALVAPETTRAIQYVPFDPDAGINFRTGYQKRFGYRGMGLIDKLGQGYTRQQLVTLGAITP